MCGNYTVCVESRHSFHVHCEKNTLGRTNLHQLGNKLTKADLQGITSHELLFLSITFRLWGHWWIRDMLRVLTPQELTLYENFWWFLSQGKGRFQEPRSARYWISLNQQNFMQMSKTFLKAIFSSMFSQSPDAKNAFNMSQNCLSVCGSTGVVPVGGFFKCREFYMLFGMLSS